ncbi:MAG TPA: hypothetical protein VMG61_07130 [Usitatibacter sp.]|nr:hypothetical protein [Usitatibacter sp.]
MKKIVLASAVALSISAPAVSLAEAPKLKCEPKPEYPGHLAMQSDNRKKAFEKELNAYKDCVNAYLNDRKVAMKSEEDAANGAIAEYNDVMKKINEAQKAAADN